MREVFEDLNFCPFCKVEFPMGPAYFCPKCGKKLPEEFSKRQFIVDNTTKFKDTGRDISSDEYNDFDLLKELKESINRRNNEFMEDNEESVLNFDIGIKKDNSDLIKETNLESDDLLKENNKNSESDLSIENKELKLDLFLKNCVDDLFLKEFLSFKNIDYQDSVSSIFQIIDSFKFDEVLDFRNNMNSFTYEDSINLLTKAFKNLDIMLWLDLEKNYSISPAPDIATLVKNFADKYDFEDLVKIVKDNELYLDNKYEKSILEQIYDLDLQILKKYANLLDYNGEYSHIELIKFIVNKFDDGFLLATDNLNENYLRGGY